MYSLLLFFHCCNQPITKSVPKPNTYNIDKYQTITSYGTLRAKSSRISSRHGTEKRERLCRTCAYSLWSRQPKTWIIMRNFRFDTGFITGFDPNRKLLIKSSSGQ